MIVLVSSWFLFFVNQEDTYAFAHGTQVSDGTTLFSFFSISGLIRLLSQIGAKGFYALIIANASLLMFRYTKKKSWGVIYDAENEEPISFAVIRVLDNNGELILQRVSDIQGRYTLIVDRGIYTLEIMHSDYETKKQEIEIVEEGGVFISDIPLINKDSNRIEKKLIYGKQKTKKLIHTSMRIATMLTFYIAFVFVLIDPSVINIVLVMLALFLFLLPYIFSFLEAKQWGTVIDAKRNIAVPFAFVRIFNPQTSKLEDIQVTDKRGRYGFLVEPGKYNLLVSAQGYRFPSKKQMPTLEESGWKENFIPVQVEGKKTVSKDLYIDPVYGPKKEQNKMGTMRSPFS